MAASSAETRLVWAGLSVILEDRIRLEEASEVEVGEGICGGSVGRAWSPMGVLGDLWYTLQI